MVGAALSPSSRGSQTEPPVEFPTSLKERVLHLQGGQPSLRLPLQGPRATLTAKEKVLPVYRQPGISPLPEV